MVQIDEEAIKSYGIPSILLMEHAAYDIFKYIAANYYQGLIVIVCGPGNNGGDGFALARQIKTWSRCEVRVLMAAPSEKLSADGQMYYKLCQTIGVEIMPVYTENRYERYEILKKAQVIVDALFGTGLSRNVEGIYKEMIDDMNACSAYTISVDLPSGIDGNTGRLLGAGVKADRTITFSAGKLGLYLYPGADYVGELEIADIGIPGCILDKIKTPYYILQKKELKKLLPLRFPRSNKGTYGKILVIGGQVGMSGAVTLTSTAALKVGAGLVTAAVPLAIHDIMEQKLTEVMTIPLKDQEGHVALDAKEQIQKIMGDYDIIAIGPGLGRSEEAGALLQVVLESDRPCVIDADGLYFLKELTNSLKARNAATIITPHPGEMARLIGSTIENIMDNPCGIAQKFSQENHSITVLKTERTVVAGLQGNLYININGNSGMAKGGSGDLLTGIIAGLWAQNLNPEDAARLGVYLHGRAGDIMKSLKTEYSFLPRDLYQGIDQALRELID